jgi:hypothetical protein
MGLLSLGQRLDLAYEARARLGWRWSRRRRASPPSPLHAAGGSDDTRADHMRPPGVWAAAPSSRPSRLLRSERGFGIRLTGKPLRLHPLPVAGASHRCLLLGHARRLALLLGELTRMHHHQPARLPDDPSVTGRDLALAPDAGSMPAARHVGLRPSGLL